MLNVTTLNKLQEVKDTNVFVQDSILDSNYYSILLKSFPYNEMQRVDVHNKAAISKYNVEAVDKFLEKNKDWKIFIEYFLSRDFINFLNVNFPAPNRGQHYLSSDLTVGYEFSILGDGAQVIPHKDKYGKLFSFVFYFVPENWNKKNNYGGTQFYEAKNSFLNKKIFNGSSKFENMNCVAEVTPSSNRLLIFEPNNTSWHGVKPISTDDTIGRPAFIVTVHRKENNLENFYNKISFITSRIQKYLLN